MLNLNSDFCENMPEQLLTVATRSDCLHVCGPMILFWGGQNVVFLPVIMYRFVFYHVSPVPVVNLHHFLVKCMQFYFMLIFFSLVNMGKCTNLQKLVVLFLFDSAENFIYLLLYQWFKRFLFVCYIHVHVYILSY